MVDVTVLGGGVIGLAIARELARAGRSVRVLERSGFGQEASWAGAGMLPPGHPEARHSAESSLRGLSASLWPDWGPELANDSRIDIGYRRTGALYLFDDEAQRDAALAVWQGEGVPAEALCPEDITRIEPALNGSHRPGFLLPTQAQVRNPRIMKALYADCARRGVDLRGHCGPIWWVDPKDARAGVRTNTNTFQADLYCVAAGSWSGELLEPLGFSPAIEPIRGQIVLLQEQRPLLTRIIEQDRRYLVPRLDGRVLVGSTLERAGFQKQVTAQGIAELLAFATELCPALGSATIERTWAGLRPGSPDGLPYLGRHPDQERVFVATGHTRWGIQLSPATALVMRQLINGETTELPLEPFSVTRPALFPSAMIPDVSVWE